MEDDSILSGDAVFENIKHFSDTGSEFWYARELGTTLGYEDWWDFYTVIRWAMSSCHDGGYRIRENFGIFSRKIDDPNGSKRKLLEVNYWLTTYACYLIAQKADLRRERVAAAQAYFTKKLYPELFTQDIIKPEMKDEPTGDSVTFVRKRTKGFKRQQARQHINYKSYESGEYSRRHFIKKQLMNSRGNLCAICGKPILDMKDCTIDHIRPVSKGGATSIENCQLAHKQCNLMKGDEYEKDGK